MVHDLPDGHPTIAGSARGVPRAEGSRRRAPADLREALVGPLQRVQVGGVVEVERRVRELHDPATVDPRGVGGARADAGSL